VSKGTCTMPTPQRRSSKVSNSGGVKSTPTTSPPATAAPAEAVNCKEGGATTSQKQGGHKLQKENYGNKMRKTGLKHINLKTPTEVGKRGELLGPRWYQCSMIVVRRGGVVEKGGISPKHRARLNSKKVWGY